MYKDAYENTRFPTIYRGIVVENDDPENKRRLKLQIPQVLNSAITEWAWPVEPSNLELESPEIGQGVWVMFEGGDPNFPVWLGSFGESKSTSYKIGIYNAATSTSLVTEPGLKRVDLVASIEALFTGIDGGSA